VVREQRGKKWSGVGNVVVYSVDTSVNMRDHTHCNVRVLGMQQTPGACSQQPQDPWQGSGWGAWFSCAPVTQQVLHGP
jgi:hypothetical protein